MVSTEDSNRVGGAEVPLPIPIDLTGRWWKGTRELTRSEFEKWLREMERDYRQFSFTAHKLPDGFAVTPRTLGIPVSAPIDDEGNLLVPESVS